MDELLVPIPVSAARMPITSHSSRFALVLVKPAHYDDDGYVIQWLRSAIPSNSLAALFGLARDCAQRRVLGEDVELEIHAFDETNSRIRPERMARLIEQAGAGMVMMVGVQFETVVKPARWSAIYFRLHRMYNRIMRDPRRFEYTDLALTPVSDEDVDHFEMFDNVAAQTFVAREQRRHIREPLSV